jgi:cyclophilin family peptidyl-prolyl cis-trans isomerase
VYSGKLLLSGLALVISLATIGCNRTSSDSQSTASIGGDNAASTKSKNAHSAATDFDLKHPQILIETSLGGITLQLDGEKSPLTVANFLSYVESGSYDQTIIHQVYKNQAILAGGYTSNMTEIRPRPPIRNEADNGLKNRRGTIAMLRQIDTIDSAASQFYINLVDNAQLDYRDRTPEGYGYCVFGEVKSGIEVVDKIANTPVQDTQTLDQTPAQAIVVKSIRRTK